MNKKKIAIVSLLIATVSFATNVEDFVNKHHCDQLIDKEIYEVCYSYRHKGALAGWTTLDGDKVNAVNIKKRPRFYENKSIPKKYRTKYSDYTGMGRTWNRGHFIVADADADYSKHSLYLVYDMCQIQPQAAKVNQKTWIKVEKYGRLLATKLGYINSITIANYKGSTKKLKNNIDIPVGFWRIYYNDDENFKKCFYYKNDPFVDYKKDKLKDHLVSCGNIGV